MNSKIGISIGCTNSCGIRKGRDSSALKVLVSKRRYIPTEYQFGRPEKRSTKSLKVSLLF